MEILNYDDLIEVIVSFKDKGKRVIVFSFLL